MLSTGPTGSPTRCGRVNLDGTNQVEVLNVGALFGVSLPNDIAIDPVAGKLFWRTNPPTGAATLAALDLNTSQFTIFPAPDASSRGIALDPGRGKLYWNNGDSIRRINYDGTGFETVLGTWHPTP